MPMKKIPIELQSLIDAQENPFVLIDADYRIVAANRAYSSAYGIEHDSIVGRKCHEVSHHSKVPCHLNGEDCPHKQVFETRQPHQVLHIHYDQHDRPEHVRIKGSPVVGLDGKFYLGEAIFPIATRDELTCRDQTLVGRAPAFLACIENLTRTAQTDAPVLLLGESGVGKDLAARYIHQQSARRNGPYVVLDCPTISERHFESELFGHERGAFTGCVGRRHGLLEQADGGTLFLNEVSELPVSIQGRLLRTLETGEFRRMGGREVLRCDVRVVSSSIRDPRQLVAIGAFRPDLYYRLAGISVCIPTLRERREDIPALAEQLLSRICTAEKGRCRLAPDALEKLLAYDFPGNVRELQNILQRAAALTTSGIITADLIQLEQPLSPPQRAAMQQQTIQPAASGAPSIQTVEAQYIADLLEQHQGHRATVADILGVSERTLYRKIKQYGLQSVGKQSSRKNTASARPDD